MAKNDEDCFGYTASHIIEPISLFEKDSDRTAFGWGWEASRKSQPMDDNPFEMGHWKYSAWREGWVGYKESLKKRKDAK